MRKSQLTAAKQNEINRREPSQRKEEFTLGFEIKRLSLSWGIGRDVVSDFSLPCRSFRGVRRKGPKNDWEIN